MKERKRWDSMGMDIKNKKESVTPSFKLSLC